MTLPRKPCVKCGKPYPWPKHVTAECICSDCIAGGSVTEEPTAADIPISMRLHCPECGWLHIDTGDFATKPHHTHACQRCGHVWRPAVVSTVGVRYLPGFLNEDEQHAVVDGMSKPLIAEFLEAGWSLVRGATIEPGIYEADTSSDGYYLIPVSSPESQP